MLLEGVQLGHYRLTRLLGRGGMGEVYLAEDIRVPRQIAIKVVNSDLTHYNDEEAGKEAVRLFQREMRAIIRLDHPRILPLFDFGEESLTNTVITYMVMPYRPEGSLIDWLRRQNKSQRLSFEMVAHIVTQAAEALQHAHDHQVVHQDVKPSNFLVRALAEQPDRPDLLLADFGIARLITATSMASQSIRGTPTYMAPEQYEGHPVAATDQYALAIMTYQLLTGAPPFQGGPVQLMHQHLAVKPAPPSSVDPRIPPIVDEVILRALEKQPKERFASVSAFARAFKLATSEGQSMPASQQDSSSPVQVVLQDTITPVKHAKTTSPIAQEDDSESGAHLAENATPVLSQIDNTQASTGPEGLRQAGTMPVATPASFTHTIRDMVSTLPPVRTGMKRIVLLGAAVCLVIISSVTALFYNNSVTRSQQEARATAIARATARVYATEYGPVYATMTASAGATATVIAKYPDPYPPNNRASLLFYDPLTGSGHWASGSDNDGSCNFSNNSYDVVDKSTSFIETCLDTNLQISNFAFEVQVKIIKGYCGGIVFRASNPIDYTFGICKDGVFWLKLATSSRTKTFISASSQLIKQGFNQSNSIAVVANGNELDLYVNRIRVYTTMDNSTGNGSLGMLADDGGQSLGEVVYNDAKVWTF